MVPSTLDEMGVVVVVEGADSVGVAVVVVRVQESLPVAYHSELYSEVVVVVVECDWNSATPYWMTDDDNDADDWCHRRYYLEDEARVTVVILLLTMDSLRFGGGGVVVVAGEEEVGNSVSMVVVVVVRMDVPTTRCCCCCCDSSGGASPLPPGHFHERIASHGVAVVAVVGTTYGSIQPRMME